MVEYILFKNEFNECVKFVFCWCVCEVCIWLWFFVCCSERYVFRVKRIWFVIYRLFSLMKLCVLFGDDVLEDEIYNVDVEKI